VHTSQVNHLHVNDLHLTGGQLVVAVSGTVSRARGNGKIVGPKIADLDRAKAWGRGCLTIIQKDPNITLEGECEN
jgi:hypothetical protein